MACPRSVAQWLALPVVDVRLADLSYDLSHHFHPELVEDLAKWHNWQPIRVCVRDGVLRLHDGKHRTERAKRDGKRTIRGRVCECGAP